VSGSQGSETDIHNVGNKQSENRFERKKKKKKKKREMHVVNMNKLRVNIGLKKEPYENKR